MQNKTYSIFKNCLDRIISFQEVYAEECKSSIEDYVPCSYTERGGKLYVSGCLCCANKKDATVYSDFTYLPQSDFESLETIDLRFVDTSGVTNMRGMFISCRASEIIVTSFDTKNVTHMNHMFLYCENIKHIDLSSFDTSNVKSFNAMFAGCSLLVRLDIDNFTSTNAENMGSMFANCHMLQVVNMGGFVGDKIETMVYLFNGCHNLRYLDIHNLTGINAKRLYSMFRNCTELKYISMPKFQINESTVTINMFKDDTGMVVFTNDKLFRKVINQSGYAVFGARINENNEIL